MMHKNEAVDVVMTKYINTIQVGIQSPRGQFKKNDVLTVSLSSKITTVSGLVMPYCQERIQCTLYSIR